MSGSLHIEGGHQRELAQYFTPVKVARFVWDAALRLRGDPHRHGRLRVLDPAAGDGVFLRMALGTAEAAHEVHGIEIDRSLEREMSDARLRGRIHWGDALLDAFPEVEEATFDIVVGNPPFGRLRKLHAQAEDSCRWTQYEIWQRPAVRGQRRPRSLPATCPIELLFVERALRWVVPGGLVALIMPEGFFANARLQWARDWILRCATPLCVVALPDGVFRGTRLNAQAGIVFLRRHGEERPPSRVTFVSTPERGDEDWMNRALTALATRGGTALASVESVSQVGVKRLVGVRWDPRFWTAHHQLSQTAGRFSSRPLGEFVVHLTYGPIVTRMRPEPVDCGVRIIRQGDITDTGLRREPALFVAPGCRYDPPRSRVAPGDVLMPRSGVGALGKNRLAVFLDTTSANVGCFVDLIRVEGLNPFYIWAFLKTAVGWGQIQALVNGVGTPNINFGEIRSLLIPQIPLLAQESIEAAYRADILPWHERASSSPRAGQTAQERLRKWIRRLEAYLDGRDTELDACLRADA